MSDTESAEESLYGRIEVLDGAPRSGSELPIRDARTIAIYRWTPPDILLEQVPADFAFELVCATGIDGMRRFWPPDGYERSLPTPLTGSERRMFEMLYYPQRCFANLPLLLLAERIPALSVPLQRMMEGQPGTSDVQILHRLLTFYAVMALNRREVDRRTQRQSRHRKDHGGTTVELESFGGDLDVESGSGLARGYTKKRRWSGS